MTNSYSYLLVALAFGSAKQLSARAKDFLLLSLSILLSLSKSVYFLIPFIGWFRELGSARFLKSTEFKKILIFGLAGFLLCMIWSGASKFLLVNYRPGVAVDAKAQMSFVLAHPFYFVFLIFKSIARMPFYYAILYTGVFGWNEVELPKLYIISFSAIHLYTLLSARADESFENINLRQSALSSGILLATLAMIFLASYVTWSAVQESFIEAPAARYFFPVTLLLIPALPQLRLLKKWEKWNAGLVTATVAIGLIVMSQKIFMRYYY